MARVQSIDVEQVEDPKQAGFNAQPTQMVLTADGLRQMQECLPLGAGFTRARPPSPACSWPSWEAVEADELSEPFHDLLSALLSECIPMT